MTIDYIFYGCAAFLGIYLTIKGLKKHLLSWYHRKNGIEVTISESFSNSANTHKHNKVEPIRPSNIASTHFGMPYCGPNPKKDESA